MAKRMKEKAARRAENRDMRPRAVARYVRISSRKVRIVIDLIRGKKVDEALAMVMRLGTSAMSVSGVFSFSSYHSKSAPERS